MVFLCFLRRNTFASFRRLGETRGPSEKIQGSLKKRLISCRINYYQWSQRLPTGKHDDTRFTSTAPPPHFRSKSQNQKRREAIAQQAGSFLPPDDVEKTNFLSIQNASFSILQRRVYWSCLNQLTQNASEKIIFLLYTFYFVFKYTYLIYYRLFFTKVILCS